MHRTFYDAAFSANTYKVRLMLHLTGLEHEHRVVRIDGAEPDPEVLKVHPSGRVPLLVEDGHVYAESNAILVHLARGTDLWSDDPREQQAILQWMFFEQNSIEPNIGNARVLARLAKPTEEDRLHLAQRQRAAQWALGVLDDHITENEWCAAGRFTVADIAVYAYTHRAEEGGIDLGPFPHIQAWIGRVQDMPDFVGMDESEKTLVRA